MPPPTTNTSRRKLNEAHAETNQSAIDGTGLAAQVQRMSAATPVNSAPGPGILPDTLLSPLNAGSPLNDSPPLKHEDYALQLMENGSVDGILEIIQHTAKLYAEGVPPAQAMDALAKILNQKQGGQEQTTTKIKALEEQIQNQEENLTKLQAENTELKKLEESRQKTVEPQGGDGDDAKHGSEDRQKKSKAAKADKKKK